MKKIIFTMALMLFAMPVFARSHSNLYIVKDATAQQVTKELSKLSPNIKYDSSNNILYSIEDAYFIKAYPVNEKIELFVYSDKVNAELVVNKLKEANYKTFTLEDKATQKKYYQEFSKYSVDNDISLVKVKKGDKNDKYKNYNPYSKKLKNKILETQTINKNNVEITRIQYKPKCKVRKKADAYEYIVKNNTGKDIIIQKVASANFIGLTQIAAYCVIPQWQDFVPIYGLVYGVQTDLEKNKFTRPHPIDEVIKKDDTMRILTLTKKEDTPNTDFYFKINNQNIIINFK